MSTSPTQPDYNYYWFARDLVASKFGRYATQRKNNLKKVKKYLEKKIGKNANLRELKDHIRSKMLSPINPMNGDKLSKTYLKAESLVDRICKRIDSVENVIELTEAIGFVNKTTDALSQAPKFTNSDIHKIVDDTLKGKSGVEPQKAYDALFAVDLEGEKHQLGSQRKPLISYIERLIDNRQTNSDRQLAQIISVIAQEFERRAGNSRASTAGNVLENALQRVFDQLDIPATGKQYHFGDLEVDNVVRGPDKTIGFSCKRTLRERFRQSLMRQAEVDLDEIWFITLLTSDMSKSKIEDIAQNNGRVYVSRESFVWKEYGASQTSLRPANEFIYDIVDFTGVKSTKV